MSDTIRIKRATAARWAQMNPRLGDGEPGYEKDTGKLKIGDGASFWNDLEYFTAPASEGAPPTDDQLIAHINSLTPHPVYDEGPELVLIYENAKV